MEEIEKKAIILLQSLIFHYHGLDDEERKLLEETANKMDAWREMEWANSFISEDYISAFERSREFLIKIFIRFPVEKRIKYLLDTWNANYAKGYLTEMETTAMLTLSKDWMIERDFLKKVKH